MGYHITLSRTEPSDGISAAEWKEFVESRSELEVAEVDDNFVTVLLDGDDSLILHHSANSASVFTKNPEGPRIIQYLVSIAPHFNGVVAGDEGEVFSSEEECGTDYDWDSSSTRRKPQYKWELSGIKRLVLGLVLAAIFIGIKEFFFSWRS